MTTATVPRFREPRARHRSPQPEPLWRQVAGVLWLWWAAIGSQTEAKPTAERRGTPNLGTTMQAIAEGLSGMGFTPPPVRKAERRVREWFLAWLDHQTASARLYMVREWCKTIMLMAGCATFLYVCWALVDWIPA